SEARAQEGEGRRAQGRAAEPPARRARAQEGQARAEVEEGSALAARLVVRGAVERDHPRPLEERLQVADPCVGTEQEAVVALRGDDDEVARGHADAQPSLVARADVVDAVAV